MSLVIGGQEYVDPLETFFGGAASQRASDVEMDGMEGHVDTVPGDVDQYSELGDTSNGHHGEVADPALIQQVAEDAGAATVGTAVEVIAPIAHTETFPDGLPATSNMPDGSYNPYVALIALEQSNANFAGYGRAMDEQWGL